MYARLPTHSPARQIALAIAVLFLGTACSMPAFLSQAPQTRGNKLDIDTLRQLVPGTSTRSDVTALLGTPTTKATFDDTQWIYIAQVTRPVIAGTQTVLRQTVYVLSFDSTGVLKGIAEKSLKDSQPVEVVARTTPSPGSESSFLQELLGNVGKFSPGGGLGGDNARQGSATNPGNF